MNIVKKWLENGRSAALAQSLTPALLALVFSFSDGEACWWMGLLAVVGVGCAHLAMNIADDWFDYKVDMKGDRDRVIRKGFRAMTSKYPYLLDGSETLRSTAVAIAAFSAIAVACGLGIFIPRTLACGFAGEQGTWWIVAIVAACAFLGVFYSAPPFKLAYRGLGELVIGVIFGPLLMMGVYYSCRGCLNWDIVWISVPVGLLVLNILFTHSFIDMPGDAESNKMTFARLLGSNKACLVASFIFIFVPFIMLLAGVAGGYLEWGYLAALVMLPRGIWLFRSLVLFTRGEQMEVEKPAKWLGNMGNWEAIRAAKLDWFLVRWFTARNLLSGFCVVNALVAIIYIILP